MKDFKDTEGKNKRIYIGFYGAQKAWAGFRENWGKMRIF